MTDSTLDSSDSGNSDDNEKESGGNVIGPEDMELKTIRVVEE